MKDWFASVVGILCIVLDLLLGAGLAIYLIVSISHRDFSPWWVWPAGVLTIGVLGIAAGVLLRVNRKGE